MQCPEALKIWLSGPEVRFPVLYLVGGTVRDLLLGHQPEDIDLVCKDAKTLAYSLGRRRNAAIVHLEKKPSEPCYRLVDRENPENFLDIAEMRGESIYDDLARRDFTINAIAAEIRKGRSAGPLIDPFTGVGDIRSKSIKMTNRDSFISDPLRILRAHRFSAQLGFTIEQATREEMSKRHTLLSEVSGERITAELLLILNTSDSSSFVREMNGIGILDVLFPEIRSMKGCAQNGFHHQDVWEHSLLVTENCEKVLNNTSFYFGKWTEEVLKNLSENNRLPLLKLSSLFHDVGKPFTAGTNAETGRITFYGHEEKGATLVSEISERLKLSGRDRDYLVQLTAEHLYLLSLAGKDVRPATLVRWIRKMKENAVPAIILGMADAESFRGRESKEEWRRNFIEWSIKTVQEYYETIRKRLDSTSLVTGRDLISLGMEPGPEMGRILDILRTAQDTGEISTRGDALILTRSLLEEGNINKRLKCKD
jgi:poly(A) polymerase